MLFVWDSNKTRAGQVFKGMDSSLALMSQGASPGQGVGIDGIVHHAIGLQLLEQVLHGDGVGISQSSASILRGVGNQRPNAPKLHLHS